MSRGFLFRLGRGFSSRGRTRKNNVLAPKKTEPNFAETPQKPQNSDGGGRRQLRANGGPVVKTFLGRLTSSYFSALAVWRESCAASHVGRPVPGPSGALGEQI